jgi:hypothetical protein
MLNTEVTQTTDPWGYFNIEYVDPADGMTYVTWYDNTGVEIEVLDPASAPQ